MLEQEYVYNADYVWPSHGPRSSLGLYKSLEGAKAACQKHLDNNWYDQESDQAAPYLKWFEADSGKGEYPETEKCWTSSEEDATDYSISQVRVQP